MPRHRSTRVQGRRFYRRLVVQVVFVAVWLKKGIPALMNGAEDTLKHAGGSYGPAHMAARGSILDVTQPSGDVPLGSSGIQIRFETKAITEGLRTGRVVRVRPWDWPMLGLPREEYVGGGAIYRHEDRFPSPAIFPEYYP